MNDLLHQEIKALLNDGLEKKSILRRLDKKGIDPEVASALYDEVKVEFDIEYVKKYRKIYLGVTLLLLAIGLFLLPITLTGNSPFLIGIPMGFLVGAAIIQTIECFDGFSDFMERMNEKPVPGKQNMKTPFIVMFVLPIVFMVLFVIFYHWEVNHEIDKYGVTVSGSVVNGYTETSRSRRSTITTNTLQIQFTMKNGKSFLGEAEVTGSEFSNAYVGQTIAVKYSSRNPEFFEVAIPESPASNPFNIGL